MEIKNFDSAKKHFVSSFQNYESQDLSELINHVVIPYFEQFACDLEELVDIIKQENSNTVQVLDYIELVFNSKIYDSYLEVVNFDSYSDDNYSYYLVILIEFTKYQQYLNIKNNLQQIETNKPDDKLFIQDLLMTATNEKLENCLNKIKKYYLELQNTTYDKSKFACVELFTANNLEINLINNTI